MTASDCVFCTIVAGDAPADRVHETERCLAFLDTAPAAPGHTLVVPKRHHATLLDADAETLSALFETVKTVTSAIGTVVEPDGVTVLQSNGAAAGQEIDHLHVHVVPRWASDEVTISWPHGDDVNPEVAAALREQF